MPGPMALWRSMHARRRPGGAPSATIAAGAAVLLAGCSRADADATGGPGWLAALALLLVAGASAAAGWLWARQRDGAALHAARQQARLAGDLTDGLAWQTDADHRLRPGALGAGGLPLWEALDAGPQAAALRAACLEQRSIDGLPARRAGADEAGTLHARPTVDARGAFAGHQGVLRPAPADAAAARALAALVDAAPGALLVAVRPPGTARWRTLRASAAARPALGDDPAALSDERIAALLPPPLRAAWHAGAAAGAEAGWAFRRLPWGSPPAAAAPAEPGPDVPGTLDPTPGPGIALVWQPGVDGADAAAGDSEQATFTYTVSHDLRAPIRVVEGFTRIVKEDYGPRLDRVANDHLDRVLGAVARMNQMIDAMLTLARLSTQPLSRQPVNLSQLAGYVVDDLRRGAPERDAVIEIEPALQARGDPTLLRLVLENLLGNAWKYTGRRPQTHIVFARERQDGREVYVVRDNGAGFDMRSAERLFGLFQRLHSTSDFPGTGVGLASVRRIVERHGGQIWADGEPGRGAAFHFTLQD